MVEMAIVDGKAITGEVPAANSHDELPRTFSAKAQRRIDKLTGEVLALTEKNDTLSADNKELRELLLGYERTIEKYKAVLRAAKRKLNGQ
jgi:predicted RNase H-like nuclease (RuvC/YqgF family)